ncbi:MAG: bifunctional glutamate N-acetyltransferase/amino-acid acetyltransferase ArgJ [Phycisphaerae bacterium]|nr:bifunctional glutamate N-acetyltransferase/amino-acid acetyltransferase ArgJ [Phycisphaerae bacterium]
MCVTFPRGFQAAAATAGLKPSGKPDLALLALTREAAEAGRAASAAAFTTNQVVGAPVVVGRRWRERHLEGGPALRAVLVNAGNSNAATGEQGERDAMTCAAETARLLGCAPEEVLPSSTGVIGRPLPVGKIAAALPGLVRDLGCGERADDASARAIMTTDLAPKVARASCAIDGREVRLGAIAKGSGMIAPNLDAPAGVPHATMLAFVTTDAVVRPRALHAALARANEGTFNRISVDAHPSCSDTAVVMASGLAGHAPLDLGSASFGVFGEALRNLCLQLAERIIIDGEGAKRIFRVAVRGAASDTDANRIARRVVDSPLVKAAIHGGDPNWGRIVTAAGNAGVAFDPREACLRIGPVEVYRGGVPRPEALADRRLRDAMSGNRVEVELAVGTGPGSSWMLGCDLSAEYVRINADYTT